MIGDEPHRPYDRPPLTKQFLAGEWDEDRLTFPAANAPDLDAQWQLGVAARALDVNRKTITLADGTEIAADGIVLACGASPRRLPNTEAMAGVHVLRTIEHATNLRADLGNGPCHVVVVGAGFIGAEAAATMRRLGHEVTLVEPLETPLARVLGPSVGQVFADMHRDEGVDVRLGVGVDSLVADGHGRVASVTLSDGASLDASVVVAGIGVIPNTAWLEGSGLAIENGVVCDATCHAAGGIVAAGDIARWPNPVFDNELMRIEHWDHAFGQAEHAAASLLAEGDAEPFATVPWFWSDQYDHKVQLAGRVGPEDEVAVVDGSLDERRFVVLYGRAGRLVGVLGMGRPRHVIQLRPKIAQRISFQDALDSFSSPPSSEI